MRIDRCVCADVTFAQALEAVRKDGACMAELERRYGCAVNCGMCRPYLRRALRTGETVFHQIITDRDEPAADPQAVRAP